MKKSFRIGIVQQKSTPFAVKQNTHSALQMIEEAASNHADLVLFPECFLTGYAFPEVDETLPFLVLQTSPPINHGKHKRFHSPAMLSKRSAMPRKRIESAYSSLH